MSKKLFFSGLILSSILGGLIAYVLIINLGTEQRPARNYVNISQRQNATKTSNIPEVIIPEGLNFLEAADRVIPGVVHVQSFYGESEFGSLRDAQSSGSGVIISDNGYIATNYHVIEDASRIDITLNDNRIYSAEIIGSDPTTDLALLKISETRLPFVQYGNSDYVKPGEWVLAIGNPFSLNSTVTAGIVSAKARNINILRDRSNLQIESFIQTDAAVNPGNSGGALVNLKGELIGINTAIATSSGFFEGYSFAVPVTLVGKVMDDLLEFGEVKRGLLGIMINDLDARLAAQQNLDIVAGVFIRQVNENGAAKIAGLQEGDVIVGIGERTITNTSELQELVARNRPGDEIEVTVVRANEKITVHATLRDFEGNDNVYFEYPTWNGLYFQDIEFSAERKLTLGVELLKIDNEEWKSAKIEKGFIITHIGNEQITSTTQLISELENAGSKYEVKGIDAFGKTKSLTLRK